MGGWYVNADSSRVALMLAAMEICWREVVANQHDITREQLAQAIVAIEVSGESDAARLADEAMRLALASRNTRISA